eukprot:941771-Karenia_brevis.AAC.1
MPRARHRWTHSKWGPTTSASGRPPYAGGWAVLEARPGPGHGPDLWALNAHPQPPRNQPLPAVLACD